MTEESWGARIPARGTSARVASERPVDFGAFVRSAREADTLVVQPRMGFGSPEEMRAGLVATMEATATTVGTITLDSYTRVGDLAAAAAALRAGSGLNGYPIVSHDNATNRWLLDGVQGADFPVQVRHGSALPLDIFAALMAMGLNATEGGPVSYCLPYGRTPLVESVRNWSRSCELFAELRDSGMNPHLETFGGCMLGQLCPPSQLVAISLLEACFFRQYGIRSISVSYAQQTNADQDQEAIAVLRALCSELLSDTDWHVVVYAYMGVYPTSEDGAYRLLAQAAELAVATQSERLIVKTVAEARQIPTVRQNVAALEYAAQVADAHVPTRNRFVLGDSQLYLEARALVDAVLNMDPDVGRALFLAFQRGYLDIPYCVHPDNMGRSRSYIDGAGWLRWADIGSLPLTHVVSSGQSHAVTSGELLDALSYVRRKFDYAEIDSSAPRTVPASSHASAPRE